MTSSAAPGQLVDRRPHPLEAPGEIHRDQLGDFRSVERWVAVTEESGDGVDRQAISVAPETDDAALGDGGDDRRVTPWFPGVRVGKVQLHDGTIEGGERVVDGPRVVGEGTGIDHDRRGAAQRGPDGVDQDALVVRLEMLDGEPVSCCGLGRGPHVVVECCGPVHLGLPSAEQSEVRARQQQNHPFAHVRTAVSASSMTSVAMPRTGSTPSGPSSTKVTPSIAFLSRPNSSTIAAGSRPAGTVDGSS